MAQKELTIGVPDHYARASQTSSDLRVDVIVAQYNVPPTPAELALDADNSAMRKGRRKEKALSSNAGTVADARARATAAQGVAGVGKTHAIATVGSS